MIFFKRNLTIVLLAAAWISFMIYYHIHGTLSGLFMGSMVFGGGYLYRKIIESR